MPSAPPTLASPDTLSDAGAAPCVSCGLCCDGTLFDRAKTSSAEAPRLRAYGLTVHDDEAHFALPCHWLDGTACTIYAERFHVCRSFRCLVLRKLEAGEITRDRADALIAEAKRLRAAAIACDPSTGAVAVRNARLDDLRDWATRPDPQDRRQAAQTYLALAALERFVQANFRLPPKSPLADTAASAEGDTKGAA